MCLDKLDKKRVHYWRKKKGPFRFYTIPPSYYRNLVKPDNENEILWMKQFKEPHTHYLGKPVAGWRFSQSVKYVPYIHVWERLSDAKNWFKRCVGLGVVPCILEAFVEPKTITACGWQDQGRVVICKEITTGDLIKEE